MVVLPILTSSNSSPSESKACLDNILRVIHSIKGTCGFIGLSKLESITHIGENLLTLLRDGKATLSGETADALLAMVDSIREILGSVESNSTEGQKNYGDLIETLNRLYEQKPLQTEVVEESAEPSTDEPTAEDQAVVSQHSVADTSDGSW